MIRDVYILRRSGEVLIHKAFSKRGVDDAIFSGFYSALNAFAEELGHGGIETIRMGDVSFYYQHADELLFAIAADKTHDPQAVQSILTDVKERFLTKHGSSVSTWNGDPAVYKQFGTEIDQALAENRLPTPSESVFAIPFALDGTRLKSLGLDNPALTSDCVLDTRRELAAVHLLLDDIRRTTSGLQPLKEGCYEFLTKLLWPIWLAKTREGHLVLVDGLKLIKPAAARGFVPPANRYEALLKVTSSTEYLAVLPKLAEEIRNAAQSSDFDTHVIPTDFAQRLRALCSLGGQPVEYGVPLPSLITKTQVAKEAETFYAEAIQTHQEATEEWSKLREHLQENLRTWGERIKDETTQLAQEYDTRQDSLKQEIDKALTQIAKQEEAAKVEVDLWRTDQERQLVAKLRSTLEPIENAFTKQRTALDQILAEKAVTSVATDKFVDNLRAALDNLFDFTSNLRDLSKNSQKEIQQTQKTLAEIDRTVKERKTAVRSRFQALEEKEVAKLNALKQEREARLAEIRQRRATMEKHGAQIDGLIQEHIVRCQKQLDTFKRYLLEPEPPLPTELDKPLYIPIYLAGLRREDGDTELLVIPPLQVPSTSRPSVSWLGQRDAPVAELVPLFVDYVKKPLEAALANDAKFASTIAKVAPRHNLFRDSRVESLLYSGLNALWQSKLIPERLHTQVKLACIEAYRTDHS
jgi:hypothetical protein